jgi:D-hexose-6-phosphate mutarotase
MLKQKNYKPFEIPETVRFEKNRLGLTKLIISNVFTDAEIYLYGANLTHFQPKGEDPVIFSGKKCEMFPDKTLHAGIPICWPWFGPHPSDSTKPQHGFARDRLWVVKETRQLENGETKVTLGLSEDDASLLLFPHAFDLLLTFIVGKSLRITLKTLNKSTEAFKITQALHSYFYVSDIDNVRVLGVENTAYIDANENNSKKQSEGCPLLIDKVINRVYIPTESQCCIQDSGKERMIIIDKKGSRSTTIWNPGKNNNLHDLPANLYRKFVCIETVNAADDNITLKAGKSHQIMQEIKLSKIT